MESKKKPILVFYPQMEKVIDFYTKSTPLYSGERILTWEQFEKSDICGEKVIILGRSGHFHQFDFSHIQILRNKKILPEAENTTTILFDWHSDIDNDPPNEIPLTSSSWAYWGLHNNLYFNLYIVGIDPSGEYQSELNPCKYGGHDLHAPMGELLRIIDKIYIYPAGTSFLCLKYLPNYIEKLNENESVVKYYPVEEGGFVVVNFDSMEKVNYTNRRDAVVISIDLDVLKRSILKTDCPQGVMDVDKLLEHLHKVHESGSIEAILICGLTEKEEQQDEWSLYNLSKILAEASLLLSD